MRALKLKGKVFGRLAVIERSGSACSQSQWRCRCKCGAIKIVRGGHLTSGAIKSCGCHKLEHSLSTVHGHARRHRVSPEWKKWSGAKSRCTNPKSARYPSYGGRGIRMCEEWSGSFEAFLRDMGPCPQGYEIDRIDVNGNYEPGNCRWVAPAVQASNKSTNRFCEIDGVRLTITDASRRAGLKPPTVFARLYRGWTIHAALGGAK